jgi:hypothetical protein
MIREKPDGFIRNRLESDMAHDPMNPFGLPHMGASMSNPGQNPLLASMEMMRQAMSGLGQSAQTATGSMPSALTPEDLERKISELKVVENWLKLNLSILSGTIQGLEVQLATVRTLRSFVAMGGAPSASSDGEPSPLEVVLGLKPAHKKAAQPSQPEPVTETPPESKPDPAPKSQALSGKTGDNSANPNTNAAAQAWWKMIEGQFAQLAEATSQANTAAQAAAQSAMAQATVIKPSAKKSAPAAKKATKATPRTAAKKTAVRPAKKTAAKPVKRA